MINKLNPIVLWLEIVLKLVYTKQKMNMQNKK